MGPARRGDRGDERGGLFVWEAVIVAIMCLAGVAFLVSFQAPTRPQASVETDLEQLIQSALNAWASMEPTSHDPLYATRLEEYVSEALMGNPGPLEDRLHALLPPGAGFSVLVETGNGTIQVAGPERPAPPYGMVAHRDLFLGPRATFLETDLGYYDGVLPLRVYGITMDRGRVVEPGGVPLEVRVVYETAEHERRTLRQVVTTAQAPRVGEAVPFGSLFFTDATGAPQAYLPASEWSAGCALPPNCRLDLRLALDESSGVAIPVATQLVVHVPPGWRDVELPGDTCPPRWRDCVLPDGDRGGQLFATLAETVRDQRVHFNLSANWTQAAIPPAAPFERWRAELDAAHLGQAELIVQHHNAGSSPSRSHALGVTIPRPLGADSLGTVGVAFGNGDVAEVTLLRLEIEPVRAEPLFVGAEVTDPAWTLAANTLVRDFAEGLPIPGRSGASWTTGLRAAPYAAPYPSHSQSHVPITFDNEFPAWVAHYAHPGVRKEAVSMEHAGRPGAAPAPGFHTYQVAPGSGVHAGTDTYEILPLPESNLMADAQAAHALSRVTPDREVVRPGQQVEITADFQGIMETLAHYGDLGPRNITLTTDIYSPVTFQQKVPWRTFEVTENELGHPPVWHMIPFDINGDADVDLIVAKGDSVYGTSGAIQDGRRYETKFWKYDFDGETRALMDLHDFDQDGMEELIVVTASGEVATLDPKTGDARNHWKLGRAASAAHFGNDCDENGLPELYLGAVTSRSGKATPTADFVGLDDVTPATQDDLIAYLHVYEATGEKRIGGSLPFKIGEGTKVRDFATGILTNERRCGFAMALADGKVRAYDGRTFARLWEHDREVPFPDGGATRLETLDTDPDGHPSHGIDEVIVGDGHGWVEALNSTQPAGPVRVLNLSLELEPGDGIVDVDMVGVRDGFAMTKKGRLFITDDGWKTHRWTHNLATGDAEAVAFDFWDREVGVVALSDLLIYRTMDGGVTWSEFRNMLVVPIRDIQLLARTGGIAATQYDGEKGGLVRIDIDGRRVVAQVNAVPHDLSSLWESPEGIVHASGRNGTVVTIDLEGESYHVSRIPPDESGNRDHLTSVAEWDGTIVVGTANDSFYMRPIGRTDWIRVDHFNADGNSVSGWLASANDAGFLAVNTGGDDGWPLFMRHGKPTLQPVRSLVGTPFSGVSRGVDGHVVASTTDSLVFVQPYRHSATFTTRDLVKQVDVGPFYLNVTSTFPGAGSSIALKVSTGGEWTTITPGVRYNLGNTVMLQVRSSVPQAFDHLPISVSRLEIEYRDDSVNPPVWVRCDLFDETCFPDGDVDTTQTDMVFDRGRRSLHPSVQGRGWAFQGLGAVERFSSPGGFDLDGDGARDLAIANQRTLQSVASITGERRIMGGLHPLSTVRYGSLHLVPDGPSYIALAGSYGLAGVQAPAEAQFPFGKPPLPSTVNFVERRALDGTQSWQATLGSGSEYDALCLAVDGHTSHALVGLRGGDAVAMPLSGGSPRTHQTPGDLIGRVTHLVSFPGQVIYGAHIVASEFSFELQEAETTLMQDARVVNLVNVYPPDTSLRSMHIYTVYVVMWLSV